MLLVDSSLFNIIIPSILTFKLGHAKPCVDGLQYEAAGLVQSAEHTILTELPDLEQFWTKSRKSSTISTMESFLCFIQGSASTPWSLSQRDWEIVSQPLHLPFINWQLAMLPLPQTTTRLRLAGEEVWFSSNRQPHTPPAGRWFCPISYWNFVGVQGKCLFHPVLSKNVLLSLVLNKHKISVSQTGWKG